jgi:hypothetical protein
VVACTARIFYRQPRPVWIFEERHGTFSPEIIGINGGAQPLGWSTAADSPWTQAFSLSLFQGVRAFQMCSSADPVCGFDPTPGAVEYRTLSVTYSVSDGAPDSCFGRSRQKRNQRWKTGYPSSPSGRRSHPIQSG